MNLLYSTSISNIDRVEVYRGGKDEKRNQEIYHLYMFNRYKRKNFVLNTLRYPLAERTYQMIQREKRELLIAPGIKKERE